MEDEEEPCHEKQKQSRTFLNTNLIASYWWSNEEVGLKYKKKKVLFFSLLSKSTKSLIKNWAKVGTYPHSLCLGLVSLCRNDVALTHWPARSSKMILHLSTAILISFSQKKFGKRIENDFRFFFFQLWYRKMNGLWVYIYWNNFFFFFLKQFCYGQFFFFLLVQYSF